MERLAEPPASASAVNPVLQATRRLVESVVIAVITSTGVYLVGAIYTDAYYGRMSIDATALDLPAQYIALQAVHAIQSLLAYPLLLLLLDRLSRFAATRLPRARTWRSRRVDRAGRLALLVVNGLTVFPLLLPLVLVRSIAGSTRALVQITAPLGELVSLIQATGLALLVYALWLSLGPRKLLLAELQQRRLLPLALVLALFLLAALVDTADRARANAERLMTGASDTAMTVTFTLAGNVTPLPRVDLLLVATRNGQYFVVERQSEPPSRTPRAYAIPFRAVDTVQMERVNPAAPANHGIHFD